MDPRELFTDRAHNYAKYRPQYPNELVDFLVQACELGNDSTVADVGAGTGIFSLQLVERGITVWAVEPNADMRAEAEAATADIPKLKILAGSAEDIPIEDRSVNLVTAAQSFHWFEPAKARQEFQRVTKHPGWVALLWNVRQSGTTDFQIGYEALLQQWAPDYTGARHDEDEATRVSQFFSPQPFATHSFPNPQFLFWEELRGRAMSASYFPLAGHANHEPAISALQELFDRHKQGGRVDFDYTTELFLGKVKPTA